MRNAAHTVRNPGHIKRMTNIAMIEEGMQTLSRNDSADSCLLEGGLGSDRGQHTALPDPRAQPCKQTQHGAERSCRATWSLAGDALPVIQQEEEGGQGHRQLEPAPVWDGIGHPGKCH